MNFFQVEVRPLSFISIKIYYTYLITPRENKMSVESAFGTQQEEIQRRRGVAVANDQSKSFARVEGAAENVPFKLADQQFALITLSHVEFGPVAASPKNPAVCVYGLFETAEDANDHARLVQQMHPEFSFLVHPTHEWFVATSHLSHLNAEYTEAHTRKVLDGHAQRAHRQREEFETNLANKSVPVIKPVPKIEEVEPTCTRGRRYQLRTGSGIANQSSVVASFVPDTTSKTPEFLMRVYAAFPNDADAAAYVCNVAGEEVTAYDIDVVNACAWIYPQRMRSEDAPKETYRSAELNRVMAAHKRNPKEVERFYKELDASEKSASKPDGAE